MIKSNWQINLKEGLLISFKKSWMTSLLHFRTLYPKTSKDFSMNKRKYRRSMKGSNAALA
jgi:hypothetical protein